MEALTQIKDRVAHSKKYSNWDEVLIDFQMHKISRKILAKWEDEAMQEYANTRCIRQRELCAEAYEDGDELNVPHFVILTAILATEE